jgi:putative transcriptional regulator
MNGHAKYRPLTQKEANEKFEGALQEARDMLRSGDDGGRVRVFEVDISDITAIRYKARLSQEEFANRLGISVATLRNWEQGRRKPTGPARRLLDIIDKHPKLVMDLPANG